MARRPADWSPLAETDPVPGDPQEVAALGRRFEATAAEIDAAVRRLRAMCTDEFWDSGAGAAFRQRGAETAGKLNAAYARYAAAATALGTDAADPSPSTGARPNYAAALAQAQGLAARALPAAQAAASLQRLAMSQLEAYAAALPPGALTPDPAGRLPPPPLAVRDPAAAEAGELIRQYNAAADAIAVARVTLASATHLRDVAAANASRLISRVINSDSLGDSWRDYMMDFIDEHARLLAVRAQVASQVATACAMLALKMGGEGSRFEPPAEAAGVDAGVGVDAGAAADAYRLTVPAGWFRVGLRPGARQPALERLAGEEVYQELRRIMGHARDNGGVEMYISPQTAAGFPLPAALVVTLTPPHGEARAVVTPKRLADTLAGEGAEVSVTGLPAGQAVRVRRRASMTSLDIHVPGPGSGGYLMLSFSTPLDELADAMVTLFDSIASTVTWPPYPDA